MALPILLGVVVGRLTAHWHRGGSAIWTVGGLAFGGLAGLVAGTLSATGRGVRPAPSRMQLRLRGQLGRVLKYLAGQLLTWRAAAWMGTWAAGGLIFGVIARLILGTAGAILPGAGAGLLRGFGIWFVADLVQGLAVIVDPAEATGPADLLRSDRTTGLRQGLITGMFGTLLILIALWEEFSRTYHLVTGNIFWFLVWLIGTIAAATMWILIGMVWGPWLIARTWLALRGKLPWAVMTFLADAHRRGVLRQAGGVYQFRHARLQHHLAADHTRTPSTTAPAPAPLP